MQSKEHIQEQPFDETLGALLDLEPGRFDFSKFDREENLHALFRYPAMMVPSVQEDLIEVLVNKNPELKSLWDPFAGSGTALVAGLTVGLDCYGQDINPLAVLVSKVKTCKYDLNELEKRTAELLGRIKKSSDFTIHSFPNISKWFSPDVQARLSNIRNAILKEKNLEIRRFFWVALAESIRFCSNDRSTTFKLHALPVEKTADRKLDCDKIFQDKLSKAIGAVKAFDQKIVSKLNGTFPKSSIALADSRISNSFEGWPEKFDLIVTSPPYGDNITTITYGQYSYLQLQWIELKDIDEFADLDCIRTTHEIDQRGLGGRRWESQVPITYEFLAEFSETYAIHYQEIFEEYGNGPRLKKFHAFCTDLYQSCVLISEKLNRGGLMVWTIGNRRIGSFEINNDQILCDFFASLGIIKKFSTSRNILNKTIPFKNDAGKTMKQEQILVFEYGG